MSDALQRWAALVDEVNGRVRFGAAGVRDPDAPCSAFDPGEPEPGSDCHTDGHYMCDECTRRASCECGCGNRPTQCACADCRFWATCPTLDAIDALMRPGMRPGAVVGFAIQTLMADEVPA